MPTRRLASVLLVAVILGGCALGSQSGPDTTTTVAGPTTTTAPAATTTTEDPAAAATRAEVEALVPVAEGLRDLAFLTAPSITIVTPDELEARVRDLIAEEFDPEEVARDQAVYTLLGIIDEGTSLEDLILDLYGEQVGGYYDSDTGELVVPVSPEGLLVRQRTVVVHELVHAVTDQHFDFGSRIDALRDAEAYDAFAAYQAVIEGDAVRVETAYIETLGAQDLTRLVAEYAELDSTVFDAAPHFIQRQLLFPYLQGLEFLRRLGADDRAVDALYADPPVSTDQVLDPDRFLAGEAPREVTITTPVPAGYEIGEASTWGRAALDALLGATVPAPDLRPALDGWAGDAYRIMWNGTDVVWQYHYVGEDPEDLEELATAFRSYLTARASSSANWTVRSDGTTLLVLVTDQAEAFHEIADALPGFTPIGN